MIPVPTSAPGVLPDAGRAGSGRRRLDVGLDRLGLRTAAARDRALAVALAVLTAVGLGLLTGPLATDFGVDLTLSRRLLFVGLSAAQALTLAVRRTRPPLCLLLVTGLQVLVTATVASEATVRGVPVVLAFFTAGAWLPFGRLLRWGGLAVALEVALTPLADAALRVLLPPGAGAGGGPGLSAVTWAVGAASIVVVYGAAAAVGVTVATRRRNVALLEARAAATEAEREADTRRAVEAERLRMARELHDVAAHHLTGLLVQASAAERLVDRDRPGAREAILEVRRQGRQALDSLRTVVGVLRDDGAPGPGPAAGADLGPVPGLTELSDLVGAARRLGDAVVLHETGAPYALAPVAEVTAYRVAQEALSNARQHAPGQPVEVALAYADDAVRLSVVNPVGAGAATPAGGRRAGFGLAGMRERAALVGAALEAGPATDGTWRVGLTLPRPGAGTAPDDDLAGAAS
ncbi:hypothetical protein GCM10022197_12140 [Microlunatus spumicola]|uniref:histidine kinase n=1 Tax=Microlunatus spumicola TaxID=81499 RepID=A0ABP6WZB6_9ACTN